MNVSFLRQCIFVSYRNKRFYNSISQRQIYKCLFSKTNYSVSYASGNENGAYFSSLNHCKRLYSEDNRPTNASAKKLPPLMDFPQLTWPSFLKTVKNFLLVTFIIRPYFDAEFSLPDFNVGSKKAVAVVSKKLANGEIASLKGLVTSDIIPTLEKGVALMTSSQREQLGVNEEDIYFSFPYQIGVIFNDEESAVQKRFVEITMVYHCLKGLAIMKARGEEPPINMGMLPEYQSRISICNYRFIREFTKGVDGDWTINFLNHFRPVDNM
ncbi:m-AAA protease-interacting protein 1, mitochondrial [Cylas formicarius]|uniref:m-AAA protease-interacting protein 1, mitochondrial n=1 Tax=Cylas formicarius TaxID=197179 RepID=UPI002958C356|nr:m-AAA protease-interacting protein 1, mitochondrial [Cylas formicarius]